MSEDLAKLADEFEKKHSQPKEKECEECARPMKDGKCSGCDKHPDHCDCDWTEAEKAKGLHLKSMTELAAQYLIKIAEHHYEENAPPNVKADDLDWIDDQTKAEIKFNGTSPEYQPFDKSHNPPGMIGSEKTWDRAKKAVKKYWKKYKEPWAVTMFVYKQMGGKTKKKSKKKK